MTRPTSPELLAEARQLGSDITDKLVDFSRSTNGDYAETTAQRGDAAVLEVLTAVLLSADEEVPRDVWIQYGAAAFELARQRRRRKMEADLKKSGIIRVVH